MVEGVRDANAAQPHGPAIDPRPHRRGVNRHGVGPRFGVIGIQSGPRDGGSTVASVGDTGARSGMLVVETIAKIRRAYFADRRSAGHAGDRRSRYRLRQRGQCRRTYCRAIPPLASQRW